ncbi:histidine kinase [Pseudooceanicola nitratireducens]|nr:histidine kinase [Pseudooceanicola nitratireducens]
MNDKPETFSNKNPERAIPLIALGASAGGLKPLEAFFSKAPAAAGWSYVVIQHLSPDYRSIMKSILERQVHLSVRHAEDGLKIEPNTVYLNNPSEFIRLEDDVFRARAYDEADGLPHLPIDYFFNSLVSRAADRTVAVVLSGSGFDGTRGAGAIHASGGTIFAQSLDDAEFTSMPKSIVKSGFADRILTTSEMPEIIGEIFQNGKIPPTKDNAAASRMSQEIQDLLKQQTNVDFSSYKQDLVLRRIERRQQLHGFRQLQEYGQLLRANPAAIDELYQDILIGVTQFYRNPEAIAALRKEAIDKIVKEKDEADPIRVWVPACASGEEAYTIAIELNESVKEHNPNCKFRVIATDVHHRSIDRAATGVYREEALEAMPAHLRDLYFDKHRDQYIIDPVLRQKLIFSVHDALTDPPFMHLDLVSCRNFLIYLKTEPRSRILSMFLFGLRKNGYLLLGPSETIGSMADDFNCVNQRWRLYQKASDQPNLRRYHFTERPRGPARHDELMSRTPRVRHSMDDRNIESIELRNRDMLIKSYNALLKRYAPSSILITIEGRVLSWFGAASAFIDTMNNLADWTVEDIVHPSLHFAINVGIEKMRRSPSEPYSRRVKIDFELEQYQYCNITIEPLERTSPPRFLLVSLKLAEGDPTTAENQPIDLGATSEDAALLTARVAELERDLRLTEETLQQVTERLEASGEELQASNEELQASNEELQASNEELQSSNEELHAVNEELVTVSAEHELKIEELQDLNENTELVLGLLQVGLIILSPEGRIRRFSQLVGSAFQMQHHDINRTLEVVGPRFDFVDLKALTDETLKSLKSQKCCGTYAGQDLTVEAFPIPSRTAGGENMGAVVIFHGLAPQGETEDLVS